MFYQLPPVGNPICLGNKDSLADISVFSDYQMQFYDSGTASLAAAIISALAASNDIHNLADAEIILPAYGCPDLVSAVVFSGAKPVLVDLSADRPWLDIPSLVSAITDRTVAVVAVNLFGIAERWSLLREIADQNNLVLIEDSAQYFPHRSTVDDWHGDMVIMSFGRGKPVSMLGGGAVLTKNTLFFNRLPDPGIGVAGIKQRLLFYIKAVLYNALITPWLYWLPQSLPFLHLGETRYHALAKIEAMDSVRRDLLAGSIQCYQADDEAISRCQTISSMLDTLDRVNNLPMMCKTEENRRLLRYPLLIEEKYRDRVYQKLQRAGLGASIMYPAILTRIPGMPRILDDKREFPNAEKFAACLLTLPIHSFVNAKTIKKIKSILIDTL